REGVDRVAPITGRVLDRATDDALAGGQPDHLGGGPWLVGVAVLQIGIDGQVRRLRDRPAVLEDLAPAHEAGAVGAPEAVRESEARRRQGLEAERREELGGADVPRIRNDEGPRTLVQRPEGRRLRRLCSHGPFPTYSRGARRSTA